MIAIAVRCSLVRALAAAIVVAVSASTALAATDSRSLSCAQVTSLVAKSGSAVIATGPGLYGTVYSGPGGCRARTAEKKFGPTRDNPKCLIGYTCRPYSGGNH